MNTNIFLKSFIIQISKFVIVGGLGALINVSILFILTDIFNVFYLISEIIAFIISASQNYVLNKIWTFKEKLKNSVIKKYFKYLLISMISLLFNISVLYMLVEFFGFWYIYAEIVAIIFSSLINFLGNKIWTFKINNYGLVNENIEFHTGSTL